MTAVRVFIERNLLEITCSQSNPWVFIKNNLLQGNNSNYLLLLFILPLSDQCSSIGRAKLVIVGCQRQCQVTPGLRFGLLFLSYCTIDCRNHRWIIWVCIYHDRWYPALCDLLGN